MVSFKNILKGALKGSKNLLIAPLIKKNYINLDICNYASSPVYRNTSRRKTLYHPA